MPSKKIRAKNKKTDTRTCKEILNTLPEIDVKPLLMKYMGHNNAFHKGSTSQKFIDTEMEPIDKKLLDNIKLFIDESQLYLNKKGKFKLTLLNQGIIKTRCQLVFVYANMLGIYERQQQIDKIMKKFGGDELMGQIIKEMACREAFSN